LSILQKEDFGYSPFERSDSSGKGISKTEELVPIPQRFQTEPSFEDTKKL